MGKYVLGFEYPSCERTIRDELSFKYKCYGKCSMAGPILIKTFMIAIING